MIPRVALAAGCMLLVVGLLWMWFFAFPALSAGRALTLGALTRISPVENKEDVSEIDGAAADPSDGQHLIICGMDQYLQQNVSTGYLYSSADAGATWRRTVLDNATKFVSEESCTYSRNGRAYFAAGESDTSTGIVRHQWGHLVLFTSGDHGMGWNRTWKRKNGWIDYTSLAAPASNDSLPSVIIFGNEGTDKLGHWWKFRPVAIASRNGGRSFSNLIAPRPPPGFNYGAVWTSGSTTLPDGISLFATAASLARPKQHLATWWSGHMRVEIFAYTPSTGEVSSRAVVRSIKNAGVFTVTMAQDESSGRFGGRLYTAWFEWDTSLDGGGTLWLASSDDRGYHWSARPILTEKHPVHALSCQGLGDIKLAVARNGILGIIWSNNSDRTLLFAMSRDGGRTFSQSIVVAHHEPGAFATSEAVNFNEYSAREVLAMKAGESETPYMDRMHLGVSIRIRPPQGISDYTVVADMNNAFHALWAQVEPNGTHALFTRTIHVASNVPGISSRLRDTPEQPCPGSGEQVYLPLPGAMPILHPIGQRDVSELFFLQILNFHYDNATRVVSVDIVLTNKGKTVVRGPLSLFGIGLHSDYGIIAAQNAAGFIQSQPFWDASSVIPASGLQPGARSKPLTLRFKLMKFRPLPNIDAWGGDASAMLIRIYQKQ